MDARTRFCLLFNLFLYIFYRFVRAILHRAQDFCFGYGKEVQIMKIVVHFKLNLAEHWRNFNHFGSPEDFLWLHNKYESCDAILNSHWQLYCVNKSGAYFVYLPQTFEHYTARSTPFLYQTQFAKAVKIARMSLETFVNFATKRFDRPRKSHKLLFLWSEAFAGPTLVTSAMQIPETFCISEPFVLSDLCRMAQFEEISDELTHACIQILAKNVPEHKLLVVKPQANCAAVIPHIKRTFPDSKHLFIFWRNSPKLLRGYEKSLRQSVNYSRLLRVQKWAPFLVSFMSELKSSPFCDSDSNLAAIRVAMQRLCCRQNAANLNLAPIAYEELVSEPGSVFKSIFRVCGLSERNLQTAVTAMAMDAELKFKSTVDKSDWERKVRLEMMARKVGLEREFFQRHDTTTVPVKTKFASRRIRSRRNDDV